MKRTKKPVVKEEIVSVELTADEFAYIAAQECANTMRDFHSDDSEFAVMLAFSFAEFSARLMHRIFDETETESEAEG